MYSNYLRLPLDFKEIKQKGSVERLDVRKSIHSMIHLITTTEYHDVRHDPKFGCDIWQYDFENIYNPHSFKEELKRSIHMSIRNNEKRLVHVKVDLQIEQVEIATKVRNKRIKTRIRLVVSGLIDKTNESFSHEDMFFIGPLSY